MAFTGHSASGDVLQQINDRDLKVSALTSLPSLTLDTLTVNSGATLPAFASLSVKSSGTSTLGTVTQGLWNGSGIEEAYGGTGQSTYAAGDILYADAANSLATLPSGAEGTMLRIKAGTLAWNALLDAVNGGTGRSSYAVGDILYADGAGSLTVLASGAEGQKLEISGGALAWVTPVVSQPTVIIASAASQTITDDDRYVMASGVGLVEVTLPASPLTGQEHTIKDRQGIAASSGITIQGNGNLIDGASSSSLASNYAATTVVWDGAQWGIV